MKGVLCYRSCRSRECSARDPVPLARLRASSRTWCQQACVGPPNALHSPALFHPRHVKRDPGSCSRVSLLASSNWANPLCEVVDQRLAVGCRGADCGNAGLRSSCVTTTAAAPKRSARMARDSVW
jgi:hypothetical protein